MEAKPPADAGTAAAQSHHHFSVDELVAELVEMRRDGLVRIGHLTMEPAYALLVAAKIVDRIGLDMAHTAQTQRVRPGESDPADP